MKYKIENSKKIYLCRKLADFYCPSGNNYDYTMYNHYISFALKYLNISAINGLCNIIDKYG